MAAGRHGGYRDNGFREGEADFEALRRDYSYSKDEYDKIRNGDRDRESSRVHDQGARGRIRVRQKDIKERVAINGWYRSASNRSDSGNSGGGPRRCGFSLRDTDREPGELSSESGSDEAIESELLSENEASKLENGNMTDAASKRRKFSPIVWNRDDKEVNNTSNSRITGPNSPLPSPPQLPKAFYQSSNVAPDGVVFISPVKDGKLQCSEPSSDKPPVELGSPMASACDSPVDLSSSPLQEQRWGIFQESERLEEEVYSPIWNISASRWADDSISLIDEGEFYDEECLKGGRKCFFLSQMK